MYTNYSSLGCRSRSTTDIFKAHSLDDTSQPPMTYGTTLTRTNTSITTTCCSSNANRRRLQAAPAPPQRSDSFTVVPSALKSARAVEARRRLIDASIPVHQTPKTKFIRMLVASLERKQKEISGASSKVANDEFRVVCNLERDETFALLEDERKGEEIVGDKRLDVAQQQHIYTR